MTALNLNHLSQTPCPACGYQLSMDFLTEHHHPLATLGWPKSAEQARGMKKLPLNFVRCLNCGHVYNRSFEYQEVPYKKNPNLMYNKSALWQAHIQGVVDTLLDYLPSQPRVIEIGCGEGELLHCLKSKHPEGQYIGFDPNTQQPPKESGMTFHAAYFEAAQHLEVYQPHMIITRHVLEHLMNPLAFMLELCFCASYLKMPIWVFIEVPCIDNALNHKRLEDFYYEHNSHFTRTSFSHLLTQVCDKVEFIKTAYGNEVIYGLGQLRPLPKPLAFAQEATEFHQASFEITQKVKADLKALRDTHKSVAIWGGTGKAAAFIHYFELSAQEYPIVVDSDPAKIGTFVPGTGQEIRDKHQLLSLNVDIIIIATQWRAKDIVAEIQATGIPYQDILLEYQGELVSWSAEHPYAQAQ